MPKRIDDYVSHFWSKVQRGTSSECWPWTGGTIRGYGQYGLGKRVRVYTHRYAYELLRGPIPDGLTLDHLCRNARCCNPAHLEPVSQAENTRRMHIAVYGVRTDVCANGHVRSEEAPYIDKKGHLMCRACRREADQRYRDRQAGKPGAEERRPPGLRGAQPAAG